MGLPSIHISFEVVTTEDQVTVPEITASLESSDLIASVVVPHEPYEPIPHDESPSYADVMLHESRHEEYIEEILDDHHSNLERLISAALTVIENGGDLDDAVLALREYAGE